MCSLRWHFVVASNWHVPHLNILNAGESLVSLALGRDTCFEGECCCKACPFVASLNPGNCGETLVESPSSAAVEGPWRELWRFRVGALGLAAVERVSLQHANWYAASRSDKYWLDSRGMMSTVHQQANPLRYNLLQPHHRAMARLLSSRASYIRD